MTPLSDEHTTRVHLPFEATSASTARHLVGLDLSDRDASRAVIENAALVVHELVMNGIDHGRPDADGMLTIAWGIQEDLLFLVVQDHGTAGVVAAQPPSPERARGRGLAIVNALSERWTVARDGCTEVSVWLRLVD